MFARAFNPCGVTDPFYFVNRACYTNVQLRKQQSAQGRRFSSRRNQMQDDQMSNKLRHQTDDKLEEQVNQRDHNTCKTLMTEKCVLDGKIAQDSDASRSAEHNQRNTVSTWQGSQNCIPHEVLVIRGQYTSVDTWRRQKSIGAESKHMKDDASGAFNEETECLHQNLPHLIGESDENEDQDEDESSL
jgi:hypothetical protein